jgi:hypothetical protein
MDAAIPVNILKTIKSIESSSEDLKVALVQLRKILWSLYNDKKNRKFLNAIKTEVVTGNVHCSLLGIIKSSGRDADTVASAANCVSLLVHGNEELRTHFADKGALKTLSSFLHPSHPLYPGVHLGRDSQPHPSYHHIDEILLAIQKLVYLHGGNSKLFVECNGLSLVVQLCERIQYNPSLFSKDAREVFERLTSGKVLQARMRSLEDHLDVCKECFQAIRSHSNLCSTEYNFHTVRLGTYDDDVDVTMAMVKEGVVWESPFTGSDEVPMQEVTNPPLQETNDTHIEEMSDTCVQEGSDTPIQEVRVSHLEGFDNRCLSFWCQVYDNKWSGRLSSMYTSLQLLGAPQSSITMATPQIGMVYAVYQDPSCCLSDLNFTCAECGWFRGRVINVHHSGPRPTVTVLAVDVGFSLRVPLHHLRTLPKECQGIPDQAVPCILDGVQPVPQYLNTLRRALGVLMNLVSFGHKARAQLMMINKSIILIRSFVEMSDFEIVKTAMTVLVNMAHHRESRNTKTMRALIPFVLDCCRAFTEEKDLLELSLTFLCGILYESVHNRTHFIQAGGIQTLLDLKTSDCFDVAVLFEQVLSNVMGDLGVVCVDGRSSVAVNSERKNPSSHLYPRAGRLLGWSKNVLGTSETLPKEEMSSKHGFLDDTTQTDAHLRYMPSLDTPPLDTPSLATPPLDTPLRSESTTSTPPSGQKCYRKGQQISSDRQTQEFIESFQLTSMELLRQHVCGFLNSFTGGTIYVGVTSGGIVRGIPLSRLKTDQLSMSFDSIWSIVRPVPSTSLLKVEFIPVIGGSSPLSGPSTAPGKSYVVELCVTACSLNTVYTLTTGKRKRSVCCIRQNGATVLVKCAQDLRDVLIKEALQASSLQ